MMGLFSAFSSGIRHDALACDVGAYHLRVPTRADFAAWVDIRARSRAFLQPWEPIWPKDDLTRTAFNTRIKRYQHELREDLGYSFVLVERESGAILGGLTLGNIRRRAAMSATLGYWMGAPHAGKGVMSLAVPALCRHAFGLIGLERIEAACLPENASSIRVLEKAGFRREGFSRGYLSIAGIRRDHVLFALLKSDLSPQ